MTKAQFAREQTRLAREQELRLLAEARATADPRYAMDAIAWMWQLVLDRKLRKLEVSNSLPRIERQRLSTLAELYS